MRPGMKPDDRPRTTADLLRTGSRKTTVILLAAPVLMVVFRYCGSREFFGRHLGTITALAQFPELAAGLWHFAAAFVLLGLVPLMLVKAVFRERLTDYGLQWGDWAFGWKALAVLAPVMILLSWPAARQPDFLAEYPLNRAAGVSSAAFVVHAAAYLCFYMGWEFCFRGFLQFGLRPAVGDWNAILIQTLASCLLHLGKPLGETLGAILGGLVWGIIAFRSRSLLVPLLTHWLLGLSLDFFILYS
jgi:uncharacterized protein